MTFPLLCVHLIAFWKLIFHRTLHNQITCARLQKYSVVNNYLLSNFPQKKVLNIAFSVNSLDLKRKKLCSIMGKIVRAHDCNVVLLHFFITVSNKQTTVCEYSIVITTPVNQKVCWTLWQCRAALSQHWANVLWLLGVIVAEQTTANQRGTCSEAPMRQSHKLTGKPWKISPADNKKPIPLQQTPDVDPMLVWCWANAGPTLNQHWFNVFCLLGPKRTCETYSPNNKMFLPNI